MKKKKVVRTIKYFEDGEKIPENAVYLSSICADFYFTGEGENYRKEVRHYFMIHK